LAIDHHQNVLARFQIKDESTRQKFFPINGIFTMMNERHQVLPHQRTYSTKNKEQEPLEQELYQQFDNKSQMDNSIIYLNKCCKDDTNKHSTNYGHYTQFRTNWGY
jgi:hypothetical protein